MSKQRRSRRPEKNYSVRAIHRPIPDVQRLTELVIRLAIQRRDLERDADHSADARASTTREAA